jgi:hypothetical protein
MNKTTNGESYQQNQQLGFRFAEIASWQVGGLVLAAQMCPRHSQRGGEFRSDQPV